MDTYSYDLGTHAADQCAEILERVLAFVGEGEVRIQIIAIAALRIIGALAAEHAFYQCGSVPSSEEDRCKYTLEAIDALRTIAEEKPSITAAG